MKGWITALTLTVAMGTSVPIVATPTPDALSSGHKSNFDRLGAVNINLARIETQINELMAELNIISELLRAGNANAKDLVNEDDDIKLLNIRKSLEDISIELNRLSSGEKETSLTIKSALDVHQQLEVNLGKVELKWQQIKAQLRIGEGPVFECYCGGRANPNIISHHVRGGHSTKEPIQWQVALVSTKGLFDSKPFCGGTLISARFVLTAAHCFKEIEGPWGLKVLIGLYKVTEIDQAVKIDVSEIIKHPDAGVDLNKVVQYDFALLKLASSVSYTERVHQVCMPPSKIWSLVTEANLLHVSGWGLTSESQASDELQETIVRLQKCEGSLESISRTNICAGSEHSRTCAGDSGGPLTLRSSEGTYMLLGVVSVGARGCSGTGQSAYANVSLITGWISQHTATCTSDGKLTAVHLGRVSTSRFSKKATLTEINQEYENGRTALHIAAKNGNLEEVKWLITSGDIVNRVNDFGTTPIYLASQNGHIRVVKFLFERGASVNVGDVDGWTPLQVSSFNGHLIVVRFLIEKGAEVDKGNKKGVTALYLACQEGHLPVVQLLVQTGADVNGVNNYGWPPLHVSSQNGHLRVVKFLTENGAEISKANYFGETSLHLACRNGHLSVVKILIEKGGSVNVASNSGLTPLGISALYGYFEVAKLLLEKGAGVNVANNEGWTPLQAAAQNNHLSVARLLLEEGADVNASDDVDGSTPLSEACINGHLDIAELLLQKGADKTLKDKSGLTPLDKVKENKEDFQRLFGKY